MGQREGGKERGKEKGRGRKKEGWREREIHFYTSPYTHRHKVTHIYTKDIHMQTCIHT